MAFQMRMKLNREIRIVLLKWLKKGELNTGDLPIKGEDEEWVETLKNLTNQYKEEERNRIDENTN